MVWPDRDVIMVTTHFDLVSGLGWAPKRAFFWPKMPFLDTPEIIGGPDLVPTAVDWSVWVRLMVTTHLGFWSPRGPVEARYQAKLYVVDRPTQLICISDIYLLCQQTNTKDIAGQSARRALKPVGH